MKVAFLENEVWWGGAVCRALTMPYNENTNAVLDFRRYRFETSNQTAPLFLSNKGRYIWSNEPCCVEIKNGCFWFDTDNVVVEANGSSLRSAYLAAMKKHFPFEGADIPKSFFETAQYNTWIELMYDQNQEDVLRYARALVERGYKPGNLIIDEGWQKDYGMWSFDTGKFPNAKAMVDELHGMGFKVMLWVVPFLSPDCNAYRELIADKEAKHCLRCKDGSIAIMSWWNGYSAMLDFCNPADYEYLDNQLKKLVENYGIDGFKFDGGSVDEYQCCVNGSVDDTVTPQARNYAWNEFGCRFVYHEFKDTYNRGGKSTVQRLCDKHHKWDKYGLADLVPDSLVAGLLGYPFICPDMIGGGNYQVFINPNFKLDEELFIRMAQCSSLFPMMQFSMAPWRVLSEKGKKIVLESMNLHCRFSDYIVNEVDKSLKSGEPIMRFMEYSYPGNGYEYINDQYMLGDDILVAPVITKGALKRSVVFPKGKWLDSNGRAYEGPQTIEIDAPIEKLPYFIRDN